MDVDQLKNEFYQCIRAALIDFSKTEDNQEVYALALDCDSDVGMISLRYNNRRRFAEKLPEYEEYEREYGWQIYGLHGSEYSAGEFAFIEYQKSGLVRHFMDSYYYHCVGDYFGEGQPISGIEENYREIFWTMIAETIGRLKAEVELLGLDTADDFIFFCCDHDQSEEQLDEMMQKTVEPKLMKRLRDKKR